MVDFDFSKLRERIVINHGDIESFAALIGFSGAQLARRLNNRTRFSIDEIISISDSLGISGNEIGLYFFTSKFDKTELKRRA